MSNLSELLPAGSSVKSADFVAQGTLASGVTVGLRSDGKVEAITGQSGSVGTKVVFEAATSTAMAGTYDSANNKVVFLYNDYGNSYYGTAIVGTVSGTAITFGSAVVFNSGSTAQFDITFDSNVNKVVIGFKDASNGNAGTGLVGTVSGTSISFGSEYVFISSCQYVAATFDSNSNKVVFGYRHHTTDYAMGIVGTVSGTAISYGSEATAHSVSSGFNALTFDSNSNKVVLTCRQATDGAGVAVVGTVSGTSISFGTAVTYVASLGSTTTYHLTFDSNSNKVVIGYSDSGNSNYGTAIVGTVSGTSISFGTPVVFDGAGNALFVATVFDSVSNKIVISYRDDSVSNSGTVITGTVSGTSISFSGKQVYASSSTDIAAVFDVNANATVSAYYDGTNSNYGTASVTTTAFSNVSSYVGITDQAISSAATGKVVCKGGAITNTGLLPLAETFGSKVVFEAAGSDYMSSAFDSANNKIVIAYQDVGNSNYGTAIVGTVSGDSITFGTPAVFASHNMQYSSTVYDPDTQKIIISYRNSTSGSSGLAIVGTVSGTSISFGTAVEYAASSVFIQKAVYDTGNNKVVITYDDTTQNATRSIVGTVSGTSISFGTAVSVNSNRGSDVSAAYDSASGKIVVAYKESSRGKARVGTVSGTSISFGGETNFSSGNLFWPTVVYDVQNEKTLIAFRDSDNSNYGTAVVGTVSGTSISFGSATVFNTGTTQNIQGTYDSTNNVVALSYADNPNSNQGTAINGTISGTSVSFGSATVFNTADTAGNTGSVISYDTNAKKLVYAFKDSGNSNYGTAIVGNLSNALTPNTAYFVQDDGTISTTSSTTKAGTALSTTSLLLTG